MLTPSQVALAEQRHRAALRQAQQRALVSRLRALRSGDDLEQRLARHAQPPVTGPARLTAAERALVTGVQHRAIGTIVTVR